MQFRTQISIPDSTNQIDYSSRIGCLGSCFSENIADKFEYFKFETLVNPFGILFSPLAIQKIIEKVASDTFFMEEDIFYYNERWHSFDVHSILSHSDKEQFLNSLNQKVTETKTFLSQATHLIITYGTSWVYQKRDTEQNVANCHKVPQKEFSKELLSIDQIKKSIQLTIEVIQKLNPQIQFLFTLSPVRHLKDGFVENQRSKAHLLSAIHEVVDGNILTNYFPSYEIVLDDLRDYRFYTSDMLHPNQMAIDYIWEKFIQSFMNEETLSLMDEVGRVQKMRSHRPFDKASESNLKLQQKIKDKIAILEKKVGQIHF